MACLQDSVEKIYFLDALNLFIETQWLYNTAVTDLLSCGLLDLFPKEWVLALETLENEELNDFVVRKMIKVDKQCQWSESLKNFVEKCKYIDRLPIIDFILTTTLPKNFQIGLSFKKQHEIIHFAHLVHTECALQNIKVIVDLGAGLGYVCQLLYHLYGYQVLGLDKSQVNVNNAQNRQIKMYPDSLQHVKYICCHLTDSSVKLIESILYNEFREKSNVCLIGLHACGDLSIDAVRIFRDMKIAHSFIMVPCCYHKLSISNRIKVNNSTEKQYFYNFPLSNCLRTAVSNTTYDIGFFLRQPFLRLACQEPADRWYNMSTETHDQHSFYVLARAVLQLYATNHGFLLKKCTQKSTRKSQCLDFETYIKDSLKRYVLHPQRIQKNEKQDLQLDLQAHEQNLIDLWKTHSNKLKIVELYTALQLMLQAPAESFLLQDRLCWMKELGFETKIIPVMNRHVSPRAYAIVSHKR